MSRPSIRNMIGCWLHERWHLEKVLNPFPGFTTPLDWQDLRNRREHLAIGSTSDSRECLWADSSWLTVARVFPDAGGRLLRHVARRNAFSAMKSGSSDALRLQPEVSVILPVSGDERGILLSIVVASFRSQVNVNFEVIVVEENPAPLHEAICREGERYVFVRREGSAPYCKSRMLNHGCRAARGKIVVLHDADIVVPCGYLAAIRDRLGAGYEAIRPLRFLFCLDEENTRLFMARGEATAVKRVTDIMQNFPGGSTALTREAFEAIGGMDERFTEWGGEDLEFLDRLNTLRAFKGGFMPAIHLWHQPAMQKAANTRNRELADSIRSEPVLNRISRLRTLAGTG